MPSRRLGCLQEGGSLMVYGQVRDRDVRASDRREVRKYVEEGYREVTVNVLRSLKLR